MTLCVDSDRVPRLSRDQLPPLGREGKQFIACMPTHGLTSRAIANRSYGCHPSGIARDLPPFALPVINTNVSNSFHCVRVTVAGHPGGEDVRREIPPEFDIRSCYAGR
jgi:hypothetical protein